MKALQLLILLWVFLSLPVHLLAQVTFENTTYATINGLISSMTATKIDGSNNSNNKLTDGTILIYRTNEGRLGKLQILTYDYTIRFRAVTYQANGSIYQQNPNLTIRGTWSCDLDQLIESGSGKDFWWQHVTSVIRYFLPQSGAVFYVVPLPVRQTLNGYVDMHTHPMSHLGFGKKLMHGAPDIGSLIPAGTRDCNSTNFRAGNMANALGHCNATHGGWGTDNSCGNYIRAAVINLALDDAFIHKSDNPHGDHHHAGYPDFPYWPHQTSVLHQQMWWEWIKRAYTGGLRVMVALTVNSELIAEAIDGDGPKDDKNSADLQLDEITSFVGRHNDFMEIARSPADLRRIVGNNKLAVIMGMEVDNLGNFNKPGVVCNEATVQAEIQRLYHKGVRYVFPIHIVDNKFGGAAVYEDLFNYANKYSTGNLYSVEHSVTVGYRLGTGLDASGNILIKGVLDAISGIPYPPAFNAVNCFFPTLGCWDKFRFIQNLVSPDPQYAVYYTIPTGHVNAKGLTPIGEFAIREMMRLGMMIDMDHMSEKSADKTLNIAKEYGSGYPINIGHNGIRGQGGNERSVPLSIVRRVSASGGVFGLGTSDITPENFIRNFNEAWIAMGNRAMAIGTDANGLEPLPKHSQEASAEASTRFYARFLLESGITTKASTGTKTWDYIIDKGVSHYGLMPEFLFEVQIAPQGKEVIKNLMQSAEYFAQMWEKCKTVSEGASARISSYTGNASDPDKANILYSNSPNPFYQQTTIRYHVDPSVKQVMIKIYTMSGVEVRVFANLPTGFNEINLDGNVLSPGLYICTLTIDGQSVATRKMIVLK